MRGIREGHNFLWAWRKASQPRPRDARTKTGGIRGDPLRRGNVVSIRGISVVDGIGVVGVGVAGFGRTGVGVVAGGAVGVGIAGAAAVATVCVVGVDVHDLTRVVTAALAVWAL